MIPELLEFPILRSAYASGALTPTMLVKALLA